MESKDALVVAAVVAAGVGDVGVPSAPGGPDDQVADGGVGAGLVPSADLLQVFTECLVPERSRLSDRGRRSGAPSSEPCLPLLEAHGSSSPSVGGQASAVCWSGRCGPPLPAPGFMSCSNICTACSRTFLR